ncbi:hypothetical protein FKM82_010561 [Ascaphus truei]
MTPIYTVIKRRRMSKQIHLERDKPWESNYMMCFLQVSLFQSKLYCVVIRSDCFQVMSTTALKAPGPQSPVKSGLILYVS